MSKAYAVNAIFKGERRRRPRLLFAYHKCAAHTRHIRRGWSPAYQHRALALGSLTLCARTPAPPRPPPANFPPGADLTNSVIDRADLDGCDLSEAKFVNAVITGTTFKGANLAGANFEDALIGRWARGGRIRRRGGQGGGRGARLLSVAPRRRLLGWCPVGS